MSHCAFILTQNFLILKLGAFLTHQLLISPCVFSNIWKQIPTKIFFQVPLNNNTLFHVFPWMLLSHSDAHSQRPPARVQDCLLILFLLR